MVEASSEFRHRDVCGDTLECWVSSCAGWWWASNVRSLEHCRSSLNWESWWDTDIHYAFKLSRWTYMKGSNTCVNKTDSKDRAWGGGGMQRILLQRHKIGTLSTNNILSHKAQCPCTYANLAVTTWIASLHMYDTPFETIEQSSLLTTRSNLVGRYTAKQRTMIHIQPGWKPAVSNFAWSSAASYLASLSVQHVLF